MTTVPGLVAVDVGNSRLKWGWTDAQGSVHGEAVALDDDRAWTRVLDSVPPAASWLLAGSNAPIRDRFADWLSDHGRVSRVLRDYRSLPIHVAVRQPERVGLDRLLNAVAATQRRLVPALIVDAGSAMTVDLVDEQGVFQGGAILPGPRLMARALKQGTAALPEAYLPADPPPFPGKVTEEAIAVGLTAALTGAIDTLLHQARAIENHLHLLLTGGDAPWLLPLLSDEFHHEPWLTLAGLLWTARLLKP